MRATHIALLAGSVGVLPPLPPTEPDVQISSFRFFTGELRSQWCNDGRS